MPEVRKRALLALKIAISLALLAWVGSSIVQGQGVAQVGDRLETLHTPSFLLLLAVATLLQLGAVAAGILRWRLLLSARGLQLPIPWLARTYLWGRFIGAFTPSTAGLDFVRTVQVARRTGDTAGAAAVVVAEKAVGLVGLVLASLALLPVGRLILGGRFAALWLPTLASAFAMAVGAGALLALLARPKRLAAIAARVPFLGRRAARVLEAVSLTGLDGRALASALALSTLGHLTTAAVFIACGAALALETHPLALLIAGNAVVVATLAPVSIGGVGIRESVTIAVLSLGGVLAGDALLVAVLAYLTGQVPALMGSVAWWTAPPQATSAEEAPTAPVVSSA